MRVLITNNTLDGRGGTEMYVRDVALALLRRGHHPVAYSSKLGDVANELRRATVPVVDDLNKLTVVPDLIHAQHHLDAMVAMLHFPQTPVVYFCHGWIPWEEKPPLFPTIQRYVAVDDLCAERLSCEEGVSPDRVEIIRNFVDLDRFEPKTDFRSKPARALVFSNNAVESGYVSTVRHACERRGIELDVVGSGANRIEAHPEKILGTYDIVFAKARSAMEAMACGAAVVVCDAIGMAGMVTPENYTEWRALNFGVRTLQRSITADRVGEEIDRYDSESVRAVSNALRADADMNRAVDAIERVYEASLSEFRNQVPSEERPLHAASRYLRSIAEEVKLRGEALRVSLRAAAEMRTAQVRVADNDRQSTQLFAELKAANALVAARDKIVQQQRDQVTRGQRESYVLRRVVKQLQERIDGSAGDTTLWERLVPVFERLEIKSLIEIGCGDCSWLRAAGVGALRYTGVDLVEEVLARNRVEFAARGWAFEMLDAATTRIPTADAVLCYDWFEHLPNAHVGTTLHYALVSGARYLIASHDESIETNANTLTGDRRALNLTRPPFGLSQPVERIELASGVCLAVWRLNP